MIRSINVDNIVRKVVEVKKTSQIEYLARYVTPYTAGCGTVEVQPGLKFKITCVTGDGSYVCEALDESVVRGGGGGQTRLVE